MDNRRWLASLPIVQVSSKWLQIISWQFTYRHALYFLTVMEVTQPAMVLANRQGVANLVCKYKHIGNAKEIRVTLLKQTGDRFTEICASTYTMEFKMFSVEDVIQCHVSPSRNNVTLTLTGLQANDTGLYVCKMERMYPPPYFMNKGNGTHLYVIGKPRSFTVLWYSQVAIMSQRSSEFCL